MKKNKTLIICIAIPLLVGLISGLISMNNQEIYKTLLLPKLAPPGWIFPIVWTILYVLMGYASYLVYISDYEDKNTALILYGIQLVLNFSWPIIFFNYQDYLLGVLCLLFLLAVLFVMAYNFYKANKLAGYLIIPYILWVLFALYLNFNIFLLN